MSAPIDRKHIQTNMYTSMAFKEYEYEEFPKAVPVVDGVVQDSPYEVLGSGRRVQHPVVLVNSPEELEALKGGKAKLVASNPDVVSSPLQIENEETIRAELYQQAELRGVKIDKRWSVDRIKQALEGGDII